MMIDLVVLTNAFTHTNIMTISYIPLALLVGTLVVTGVVDLL